MNRRAFLQWLGGTAAGVALAPTLDLERLLWVPGEKTIFLPAVETYNTLITPEWVTRDVMRHFKNKLVMLPTFDRQFEMAWSARRETA